MATERKCGELIDDMESGSGRICEGIEGRRGVWYAFNDGWGTQWPAPTEAGTPIAVSALDTARGTSHKAMHTTGSGFTAHGLTDTWGGGIGLDFAHDGQTYGLYDARGYRGITFWARASAPLGLSVRISTQATTAPQYGGGCQQDYCPPISVSIELDKEWKQYWVWFVNLGQLERDKLTNLQFLTMVENFDFWIDDVAFAVSTCCPAFCPETLQFSDPALSGSVEASFGVSPSCDELCNLRSFGRWSASIENLGGLECLAGLENVDFMDNQLSDLSPLHGLGRLSSLALPKNRISDLLPLSDLTALKVLDLSNNSIRELAGISSLSSLTTLSLAQNKVDNLSPLASLVALETLELSNNSVRELTALASLSHLKTLRAPQNQISDVSGLATLSALEELDLSDNRLVDAAAVQRLPNVARVTLARNKISKALSLVGKNRLSTLDLSDNQLGELVLGPGVDGLVSVVASGNEMTVFSVPEKLPNLFSVDVSKNQLTELPPGANLGNVSYLDVSENRLTQLDVSGFNRLSSLQAQGNQIQSLAGFSALTVHFLNLSKNALSDLSSLSGMTLVDASSSRFYESAVLDLSGNQITDLAPLLGIAHLAQASINLLDNPIDCAAQADNIAELRAAAAALKTPCP